MGELVLRLFFYGAIAFVPNSSSRPEQITAYLLNVPSTFCEHLPLLQFTLTPGSSCPGPAGQTVDCSDFDDLGDITNSCCIFMLGSQGTCICPLGNVRLAFDPPIEQEERYVPQGPKGPRPSSEDQESDLSWILRIKNIDQDAGRIKPESQLESEKRVGAEISFGWENAQTCELDEEDEGPTGQFPVRSFSFVDANEKEGTTTQQSLAEEVMFDVRLPIRPVKLKFLDWTAHMKEVQELALNCDSGRCPDISIGNILVGGGCDEEEISHHFSMYYDLSRISSLGLVPKVKDIQFVSTRNGLCDHDPVPKFLGTLRAGHSGGNRLSTIQSHAGGVGSRIICPMAYFEP